MPPLRESASQTAGPYVHIGLTPNFSGITGVYPADLGRQVFAADAPGERITIRGRVIDGDGKPVTDCVVELWQADAEGRHAGDRGWARCPADGTTGGFMFETIKPGRVLSGNGHQAAHVSLWIVARGINIGLSTRMYFSDEDAANAEDPVLARVQPERRGTLIGRRDGSTVSFDIHLQGEQETVFFDI